MALIFYCLDCKRSTDRPGFNLGGVPLLPCSLCDGELCECSHEHDVEFSSVGPDELLQTSIGFLEPKSELIEPDFMDDGDTLADAVLSPNKEQDDGPAIGGLWVMAMPHGQTIGWG